MNLKIFSGRSNESLAREIVEHLREARFAIDVGLIYLGELERKRFSDKELYARYLENIRGADVFIVQSTNQPHENDEELRMMINTAALASADRVTAVIPYFGYARQDRKDKSRAPVSAVRKVVEYFSVGADRLLVLDVHSSAVEIAAAALLKPCDHLWAKPVFVKYIRNNPEFLEFMEEGFVVAGPDLNAGKLARGYAEALGNKLPIAVIEKRRDIDSGDTEIMNVVGNVHGKNVLLVDDMIDSGGTLGDAARAFKKRRAKRIFALAPHGVFQGERGELDPRLLDSPVERILVTNSIARDTYPPKVEVISVAELLAEAIFRIHMNQSVSSLIDP